VCGGRGEKRIYRCAPSFLDEDTHQIMTAYHNHQQGILPGPGAWSDQTAVFAKALRVVASERNAIQAEQHKTAERRAKQKRGRR